MNEYFFHIGIGYGIVFLAIELLFFFVGLLVLRCVPSLRSVSNQMSLALNALMVGMTTVVPVFAIVWCRGNSIMWIAVLLWLFYFVMLRLNTKRAGELLPTVRIALSWDVVLILLLFSLIIYLAFFLCFFIRSAGTFFFDFYFYGNASSHMLTTHTESANFYGLLPLVSPYHYGELWLSAFVARLFGLKPVYALVLCAYPYFAVLCMMGLASICKSITKTSNRVAAIGGFGSLFLTPLPSLLSYGHLAGGPKSMVIAAFVIMGAASFLDKNKLLSFVMLLFAVPFYSTIAPGILTFCFCYAVYEFSRQGVGWKSFFNPYTLLTLSVAIFYCLFYSMQVSLPYSEPREFLYEGNWIHNALLFFVKRTGCFLVGISPTLVLLAIVLRKGCEENRRSWVAVLACFFISVMSSAFIGGVMKQVSRDGGQVFTNFMVAMTNVVFYSALLYICVCVFRTVWPSMQEKNRRAMLSLFVVLISVVSISRFVLSQRDSMVYPVADRAYNEKQYDLLMEHFAGTNPVFGCFYLQGQRYFIKEGSLALMMPHVVDNGSFPPYDLSCLQVPETVPKMLDDSHSRALWQYVQIQKQNGTYVSDNQSLADFIVDKKIEYFLVSDKEEIPEKYRAGVRLLFQFEDEYIYQIDL